VTGVKTFAGAAILIVVDQGPSMLFSQVHE
jgi:hypothetical protein